MTQRPPTHRSKRESTEGHGRMIAGILAAVTVCALGAALVLGLGRGTGATARGTANADSARALMAASMADSMSADGVPCPPAAQAIGPAVVEYVKRRRPTPQRFLAAIGTPDALPEDGMRALQDRGPTWYFPADSAGQAKVRARLEQAGRYATLLVLYQGISQPAAGQTVVRLSGRYIGAADDGLLAPEEGVALRCRAGAWSLVDRPLGERSA